MVLEIPGGAPIILDLGTGLRPFGDELAGVSSSAGPSPGSPEPTLGGPDSPVELTALLTHLHWDHLIGLPFFAPLRHPMTRVEVFGPPQPTGRLQDVLVDMVRPPFFPVEMADFAGHVELTETDAGEVLAIGSAKVAVRRVPHVGVTLGFRVEAGGATVAFVSDHQRPPDGLQVDRGVLELCDGVDLLIHDAQYSSLEFASKVSWGHSTPTYAVHVAREAGARGLALFHHDPSHDDEEVDRLLHTAADAAVGSGITTLFAAAEGGSFTLGNGSPPGRREGPGADRSSGAKERSDG